MLIDDLWAKSPSSGASRLPGQVCGPGYPLLPHLLDVAAVARELLEEVPCPVPPPCSAAWLATLAGAHDLGKASPGFQAKLGATTGRVGAPDRHDASTVPLLTEQLVQRGLSRTQALTLANAVGAHHGSVIASTLVAAAGRWPFDPDWREAHDQIMKGLLAGTEAEGLPALPSDSDAKQPFLRWLMGLTTVADWIGSSEALCDSSRVTDWNGDARAWFNQSRALARQALADIGLAVAPLIPSASGAEAIALALAGWAPRPLQQAVATVIDDLADEPGLLVIEAPMGEGKSEAGLGCARGRGLYMAMPTQATSNALYGRVAQFLSRLGERPPPALAHGAGGPWAAQARLREIGLGTPDSSSQAGWWFKGSKRALLAADGIGTVDQALIGVLNARHHFVRLFGLTGRTVILDELHAYDSYTGGLIERLCSWLQGLGCRVVLMSATLPEARRDSILRAWAGEVLVPTASYPRVSWARPGSVQSVAFPARRQQQLRVRGIAADAVAAQAAKAAQAGARVLVVVNKVRRAQELFQALGPVPATLFHARFPMDQRLENEKRILEQFGPGGSCSGGHVLVATQVAEQSLDIDMDVLFTDIAPVDLVLQRAGRIHRHQRLRPVGFDDPLILVAGLEQEIPPTDLTSFIYDRWLVLRSAAWLQANTLLQFPADIDRGVQQVYGQDSIPTVPALAEVIEAAWPDHQAEEQRMIELARQATSEAAAPMDDDIADGGAQFGTRLGQDSQSIVPVTEAQLKDLGVHAAFLAGHYLRVAHRSLMGYARATQWPPGWRDQPGLRHHRPVLVDESGTATGFDARFDPELGLVIG